MNQDEKIINYNLDDIFPDVKNPEFSKRLGINFSNLSDVSSTSKKQQQLLQIYNEMEECFKRSAFPIAIMKEITNQQALDIYNHAREVNAADAPIGRILQSTGSQTLANRIDRFVLFAFTLGQLISDEIKQLMDRGDWAQGYILDTLASIVVESAVAYTEKMINQDTNQNTNLDSKNLCLNYSPGYCGWNIRSQPALFQELSPEKIAITLNKESCLMDPIKSVSGIMMVAPATTHLKLNSQGTNGTHSFCSCCKNRSCVERIKYSLEYFQ
ncbi:MAG: hypothetical protein HQK49_19115 [Oligoflexia bacterium]|nr:hypothetical protein [Oligoflexia bacterium]